jgi:hypothetical protein
MSSKKKEVAPVSTNDQNGPRPEDMKSAAIFVLHIDEGKTLECNDSQVDSPSEEEEEVWDTEEAHQEHFAPRPRPPTQEVRHGAEWVRSRDEDSIVCISEASSLVDPQEEEIEAIGAILVDPKAQECRIEKRLKENQKLQANHGNSQDHFLSANFLSKDVYGCLNIDGPFCHIGDN